MEVRKMPLEGEAMAGASLMVVKGVRGSNFHRREGGCGH
jgi:hypothetical protein